MSTKRFAPRRGFYGFVPKWLSALLYFAVETGALGAILNSDAGWGEVAILALVVGIHAATTSGAKYPRPHVDGPGQPHTRKPGLDIRKVPPGPPGR